MKTFVYAFTRDGRITRVGACRLGHRDCGNAEGSILRACGKFDEPRGPMDGETRVFYAEAGRDPDEDKLVEVSFRLARRILEEDPELMK